MSRENAATKADRYLLEGRIIIQAITPARVEGVARGDGHLWRFGWWRGSWWCACPARSDGCCHLRAARKVVAVDLGRPS